MHSLSYFIETYNSCLTTRHQPTSQQLLKSRNEKVDLNTGLRGVSALHGIIHILYSIN